MSVRQLQQACRDRGLPTARDKDTMIERLTGVEQDPGEPAAEPAVITVPVTSQTLPALTVWQERYPAGEHLPDREHQANCAAVVAAAEARGYTVQGGGRRVGTVDGSHVYEVFLRRGGQR